METADLIAAVSHVSQLSFFDVLFSSSGLVILLMAVVCAAMLALFLPGGFRKVIAIIMVLLTAGLAVFFLRRQKNQLISDYNRSVDKYLDVVAEKQRIDTENNRLLKEIDNLEARGELSTQQLQDLMVKYENALKQANKKRREQADLSSEIDRGADKLDSGYALGGTAAFRDRWQQIRDAVDAEPAIPSPLTPSAPGSGAPVALPPKVQDDAVEPASKITIDVRFDGHRLKGDVG